MSDLIQSLLTHGGGRDGSEFPPNRTKLKLDRLAWDSLRLLLALSESGSFRSASTLAGVALNTIRTKIDRLEAQFGTPLIIRSVEGVRLTQEGHELVSIARQMQLVGHSARRVQTPPVERMPSRVRVTVTEGLGTFWLVPRLIEFHGDNPDIGVDLNCDMTAPDVLFRDTDVAIQLGRPTSPGLVAERVGSLHVMPFASACYLARRGIPASLADAIHHDLVWQESDQIATEALAGYIALTKERPKIVLTTNTSSSHYWAVSRGAGVGFLPTYARAIGKSPSPIDIGVNFRRDVFIVHHPGATNSSDICSVLAGLREAFDGDRFPWFAEDFIHPDLFEARLRPEDRSLFDGFHG
ncbi:MAG: LysR family transcriptional regulator [Sphingomonadales bacterium]